MLRLLLPCAFCFASCITLTAIADPKSEKRALDLYQESEKLYKDGEFAQAADKLREAYALDPNPDLLYNLARSLEGLGEFAEAADAYERYLASAKEVPDRKSIEARVRTLRAKAAPPPEAKTSTEPTPRPEREPSPGTAPTPEKSASIGPLPWILGGVGLAALATGGVLRIVALSKHDDAENAPNQIAADEKQSDAESLARVSNLTLVAGGVLTAAGVTLGVVELSSASPAPARSGRVRTPFFVSVSGRF